MDNLEHRDDVPFFRFAELRHQENGGGEQTFGGVIEISVLPEAGGVHSRQDDGLGDDFGVPLGLGLVEQIVRVLLEQIHVFVHQVKKIESIAAGRIAQVDDRHLEAVAVPGDGAVIPG